MTAFKDQAWSARFGAMGDEAEQQFEELQDNGFVRFGLCRPPVQMSKLPPFLRYTPDYLTSSGLVEVQGVGRDRLLKVKVEKALSLQQWSQHFTLTMFIWDSKRKDHTYVPWERLWNLFPNMPMNTFPEGKQYWEVNVDEWIWDAGNPN